MAVANYHDVHGSLPPPYLRGPDGRPWHSWRVLVLPYIEQQELYDQYRFDEPWDGPNNRRLAGRMPKIYAFHGGYREGETTTNYVAVVGRDTAWPPGGGRTFKDIADGTSNTVLIAENRGLGVHWMEPRDLDLETMSFEFNSPAGVSSWYTSPAVATVNGGVMRLTPGLRPAVLRALLTATGGEDLTPTDGGGWDLIPDGRLRDRHPADQP